MTLKIEIVKGAYSEIRISGLTVQPSPNNEELGLTLLEDMMEEYEGKNICVGYNFEDVPDANTETLVERRFNRMMKTNLAINLVAAFNKIVPRELTLLASASLSSAASMVAAENIREVQYPRRHPRGSGNARRNNRFRRFMNPPVLPPNECATNKIVESNINDYEENYSAYLGTETIASFVITADPGLTVQSSSNDDPFISYRVKASDDATQGTWRQIKLVITTSSGRIETRLINFQVGADDTVGSNN